MSRIFWSVLILAVCLGGNSKAHPHVFIDAQTGFSFNPSGQLEGLQISWTYDEFTTLTLFETLDLDKDGDGLFNDADRAAVVEGETNWPPEYKGDVYLEIAGKNHPLGRPEDARVTLQNNKVQVSFYLPLPQPAEIVETRTVLRLYDPSFYYAYTILPASEAQGLPTPCRAEIVPFEPDAAANALQEQLAALSREDTPTQQNVGRHFSDEVILKCG